MTFKIEEGLQYRVATVNFQSSIGTLDGNTLRSFSRVNVGSLYNAEALEKSVEEMQIEASRRGYAFAIVRPRGDRNFEAHTVSIIFAVDEGPRTYIERINVRGNTRTRDYVIRREFDLSEGDAYNRALVDRAERRLNNLDFFKSVKITTEPGFLQRSRDSVVDLEEKSTGDFSVSGGYSTTDGALAEVSISERNFLGRGLYAKASVTYGQYARGLSLSFVEPYLLDYRVALGLDCVLSRAACQRLHFVRHQDAGLQSAISDSPCAKICPCSFGTRSISSQSRCPPRSTIVITSQGRHFSRRRLTSIRFWAVLTRPVMPRPVFFRAVWLTVKSSLPVRQELANGPTWTSSVGYSLNYNTLDNNKNPTDGLLIDFKQDFAGVGGDVSYLKSAIDGKYYTPLVADIVGLIHVQSGMLNSIGNSQLRMLDQFQMGPNLVRGFAPNGIGPRDLTFFPYTGTGDALGGTKYWGVSAELQMPFWFLPKEVGLKGAVYADAGSLWDYQGPDVLGRNRGSELTDLSDLRHAI